MLMAMNISTANGRKLWLPGGINTFERRNKMRDLMDRLLGWGAGGCLTELCIITFKTQGVWPGIWTTICSLCLFVVISYYAVTRDDERW